MRQANFWRGLLITICICLVACTSREERGLQLFREYVINPVPASVRNLRARRSGGPFDYFVVFYFELDSSDFDRILAKRPYVVPPRIEGSPQSFAQVSRWFRIKNWPDPNQLESPLVYWYYRETGPPTYYILTNEKKNKVFLCVFH